MPLFRERLTEQLTTGAFRYVVVAQRFTPTMERTVEYLNAITPAARFYAVELVRFAAEGLSAFEARTVLKPELQNSGPRQGPLNEARFLEQIEDDTYCEALQELLETCHGLGLRLPWGTAGTSIRLQIPGRSQPLSIGWLFPPGISGWMGLIDLTLGFDAESAQETPAAVPALEDYLTRVVALPGVEIAKPDWASGYHLNPDTVVRHRHQIADILAGLVQLVSEKA